MSDWSPRWPGVVQRTQGKVGRLAKRKGEGGEKERQAERERGEVYPREGHGST